MPKIVHLKYLIILSILLIVDIILALCICLVYTNLNTKIMKVPIGATPKTLTLLCGCTYWTQLLSMEGSSGTSNCTEYPTMVLPSRFIAEEDNAVDIKDFPYLVSVQSMNWADGAEHETTFTCSGVILNEYWVLVASGCVTDDLNLIKIRAGTKDIFEGGSYHGVTADKYMAKDLIALEVTPVLPFNENISNVPISYSIEWKEAVSVGWDEDRAHSRESKISLTRWKKTEGDYTKEFGRLGMLPVIKNCGTFTGRPLISECNMLIGIGYCLKNEIQYFINIHDDDNIMYSIMKLLSKIDRPNVFVMRTDILEIYGDDYTPLVPCN